MTDEQSELQLLHITEELDKVIAAHPTMTIEEAQQRADEAEKLLPPVGEENILDRSTASDLADEDMERRGDPRSETSTGGAQEAEKADK